MSAAIVSILVCLALFSMAFATRVPPLPVSVPSIEFQCLNEGFAGACNDINFSNGGINCAEIWCRRKIATANGIKTGSIGYAAFGTKCGGTYDRKICENGRCVNLGSRQMPMQYGSNPTRACSSTPPRPLSPPRQRYF